MRAAQKAKHFRRVNPRKSKKPAPAAKPAQQAIIVRAPNKDWMIQPEEAIILKNQVCPNATDAEFEFCLAVARRHKLDPFQKQIHFVPRWNREAESTDGEKGGKVWVPIVGIDGLLHIASRDHSDYGSFSEPEYGPMRELSGTANRGTKYAKPFKIMVPDWCRIEAWKKGASHPTVAKVWWDEIYPDVSFSPTVRKMPRLMLAKCCKAQATRTAYPKAGGLLIPEEVEGSREFQSFTPEGRIVSVQDNPHLSHYEQREKEGLEKLTQPQRAVVEERMKTHASTTSKQPEQNPAPCLFYRELGGGFVIAGTDKLLHDNRDLFVPLFDRKEQHIFATPQQLGKLIAELERRKVPIRAQNREPGE